MKPAKTLVIGAAVAAALLSSGCRSAPAAEMEQPDGAALFNSYCTPCHGPNATGNAGIEAPNLTGLPEWYIEAELHKFRGKVRGYSFDDITGLKMRPMSMTLNDDLEVKAVAAYIAVLPVVDQKPTLEGGNADKGKISFATCSACHGADAAGNQKLGAPPLKDNNDWYLLTQIKHFKAGIRGANPQDATGQTMAPMAKILPDEQAMKDVIAYIHTL